MTQHQTTKKLLNSLYKEIDLNLFQSQVIARYLDYAFVAGYESNIRKQKGGLARTSVKGIDKKGNVIGPFESMREATRYIGGGDPHKITKCIKGEYSQYKGYTWIQINE